jgi:hypothetical protein
MKKILFIFCIGLISFTSCQRDVLDKQPLDIISDPTVWKDPALINSYLTEQYARTAIFTQESALYGDDRTKSEHWAGWSWINQIADEGTCGTWGWPVSATVFKAGNLNISGGFLEWWEESYKIIRALYIFIEKIPNSPLEASVKKARIAEARFLIAFNYFNMVKRYGGVPLITKVQNVDDPKETLYPVRDPEQKVYDFVISEVDAIVGDLNEVPVDYGRPTKYTALALKSRAALYAGSIAQFGTIQLNGLLGIPAASAPSYYQKSYDAAKAIITSGKFALYNAYADKVKNFRNLFLVKRNSEVIFAKQHNSSPFTAGGNSWNYDFLQCPKPHAWDAGNEDGPKLEMAEEFEYVDGTPGKLDRTAIQQGLWTMDQLWGKKDPRFFATIYTMGTPWKGTIVDPHNGILLPDGTIQTSGSYNGVPALGTQKQGTTFQTSFGVMKMLDESADNMQYDISSTDYTVFRYGEVLLNLAEAAFELGKPEEALDAVNQIRTRAGIAMLASIDREKIRHERKVELAFEGHRYWDLRRWRTAESVLSVNRSGLRYILDYATGKYKLQVIANIDGVTTAPKFFSYNYYFPITLTRTGNNSKLVENPGYK